MPAPDSETSARWEAFYKTFEGRPPSPLLCRALALNLPDMDHPLAIDLGCGSGIETRLLLERGWRVLAIDQEASAIERLKERAGSLAEGRLRAVQGHFETLDELAPAQLIHAGLAWPFCRPDAFARFWQVQVEALQPGALLVGQLFGERDQWATAPDLTFHSRSAAQALCAGLHIEHFEESEGLGKSLRGPKHNHRFDLILRKP